MPAMIFLAGAIAGGVVGLVAGALLQRRAGGSSVVHSRGFATDDRAGRPRRRRRGPREPATDDRDGASRAGRRRREHRTTHHLGRSLVVDHDDRADTTPTGLVRCPTSRTRRGAQGGRRGDPERAGLEVKHRIAALSNVPPGFVISQSPLPEAMTAAGSTVRSWSAPPPEDSLTGCRSPGRKGLQTRDRATSIQEHGGGQVLSRGRSAPRRGSPTSPTRVAELERMVATLASLRRERPASRRRAPIPSHSRPRCTRAVCVRRAPSKRRRRMTEPCRCGSSSSIRPLRAELCRQRRVATMKRRFLSRNVP